MSRLEVERRAETTAQTGKLNAANKAATFKFSTTTLLHTKMTGVLESR